MRCSRKMTYLRMCNVLADLGRCVFALGGVQQVPKHREPLVQEADVGCRGTKYGRGEVFGLLAIDIVFGVGIHRVAAEPILAILFNIDGLATFQYAPSGIVHFYSLSAPLILRDARCL